MLDSLGVSSNRTGYEIVRVITVNPMQPRPDRVAAAAAVLEAGQTAALPTETFYGLAVDCSNAEALLALNRLKRKPENSPLLLLMGEPSQVVEVADSVPPKFEELAQLFWPGPLTLVIPASPRLPAEVSGGLGTVAVRVPGLALPRHLARALGKPVTGVSANLHGQRPCRTAADVAAIFPDGVEVILDGGPSQGGAPSTIIDLTREPPMVLREGILPSSSLSPFLPDLRRGNPN
jgi:tRNA threonylcarbamoyl adenosine modification protein (Sua5/YciO/YrdC/YwlC family)